MRRRITFIQEAGAAVDPATLELVGASISGPRLEAAREDRFTFALDELPSELQALLKQCHELHIRWVGSRAYHAIPPLLSRLSPGFHLFYTPRDEGAKSSPELCSALGDTFGEITCSTPAESFTSLPNDRFSHSSASQFYHQLESLSHLGHYTKEHLCPIAGPSCSDIVRHLSEAISLDISYDTISHAVKVTILQPFESRSLHETSTSQYRTEVGILAEDKPANLEPHELGISGLITVLGQDSKPSPTLFSISSRHRDAESWFLARFLDPVGLHPTLQLRLGSSKPPEVDSYCSAHAYLNLPRAIFADKYQLADDLFMKSKNLTALRHISRPVDLEAPEYVMKLWGSTVLLELASPENADSEEWTVEIPLHLRYLSPSSGGYQELNIPYPTVFWACASEEGTKFPSNPFERVNLGYDGLFGPRTVFWHIEPRPHLGDQLFSAIRVPVLDTNQSSWVNVGTAIAVMIGFAWVTWKVLTVYFVPQPRGGVRSTSEKKTQ